MAFTTQTFIFLFFPISVLLYYVSMGLQSTHIFSGKLKKYRITDISLIFISSCFYMWACFDDIFRFFTYIILIYVLGKSIELVRNRNYSLAIEDRNKTENKKYISLALPLLFISVFIVLYILIHFKYKGLTSSVWNYLFKDDISPKSYLAPLGISFITFSAISYLTDIYIGKAEAGNLIDCALYLLFFPKVVSGPIVLWRDFSKMKDDRKIKLDEISNGINRIMIGFSKKLILADTFASTIASASGAIDRQTAWGVSLLYMLQIYYDFSGYSDIAIGIAKLLGYNFKENFNFPYLSLSITEFWRRWHISLGTWFREYVYFPLGGSRHGKKRTIINVAVIFILTGIWHGAGWTYMLWGMINGFSNILEKLIADKTWYKKTPSFLKWFITMVITFFCWELFRFSDMTSFIEWIKIMFSSKHFTNIPYTWKYYFDYQIIFLSIIGIIGATLFGLPKIQKNYNSLISKPIGYILNQIIIVVLFVVSILFMVNSTYSPFIYFQY